MRWRVLTAVVLLCAILTGGLMCRRQVIRYCDDVLALLQPADGGIPHRQQLEQALESWEQALPQLSSLLHQDRLERVGQSLSAGLGALRSGDEGGCLAQIGTAIYLLRDIREYDDILWQTLF